MRVQACKDGMEHGIPLLSLDVTGRSHIHCWLLLKVLLRSLFSLILVLCLVFFVVYHHQNGENNLQNRVDQHPQQEDHKNPITSVNLEGEFPYLHQKVEHFSDQLGKSFDFHSSVDNIIEPHRNVDGSPTRISTSNSAVSNGLTKESRRKSHTTSSGAKMSSFVKILQDLLLEGLLKLHHKILFLDTHADKELAALKTRGFENAQGFNLLPALSKPERAQRNTIKENLADQSFDFVFTRMFDHVSYPALFVAEIERTLKIGGFAAMHVSLNMWRNKYISSERGHGGIKPVTLLFKHSEIVYVSTAYAPGLDTIIVFKKVAHVKMRGSETNRKRLHDNALILVDSPEPSAPYKYRKWAEERQWKSLKYIPKLWDIGRMLHTNVDGLPPWSGMRPIHDEVVVKKSMPISLEALLVKSLNFVPWLNKAMVQENFSAMKMRVKALFDDRVASVEGNTDDLSAFD